MDVPIAALELGDGTGGAVEAAVLRAGVGALVVDRLRGGDDDFAHRQVAVADRLQHQGGADAIGVDELGDLRHVATVGRLVEDNVDPVQRPLPGLAMPDVTLHELGGLGHPGWLAVTVRLPLQVVEDAHVPAGGQRRVDDVRADQPGAAGDEGETGVMG